jgi:hypothetical protein
MAAVEWKNWLQYSGHRNKIYNSSRRVYIGVIKFLVAILSLQ